MVGLEPQRFTEPPDDVFMCSLCKMVLTEPVEVRCGGDHLFCVECVEEWCSRTAKRNTGSPLHQLAHLATTLGSTTIGDCPTCQQPFESYNPPSKYFMALYNKLELQCQFSVLGCREITDLKSMELHQSGCSYNPEALIPCSANGSCRIRKRDNGPGHVCVDFLKNRVDYLEGSLRAKRRLSEENQLQLLQIESLKNQVWFLGVIVLSLSVFLAVSWINLLWGGSGMAPDATAEAWCQTDGPAAEAARRYSREANHEDLQGDILPQLREMVVLAKEEIRADIDRHGGPLQGFLEEVKHELQTLTLQVTALQESNDNLQDETRGRLNIVEELAEHFHEDTEKLAASLQTSVDDQKEAIQELLSWQKQFDEEFKNKVIPPCPTISGEGESSVATFLQKMASDFKETGDFVHDQLRSQTENLTGFLQGIMTDAKHSFSRFFREKGQNKKSSSDENEEPVHETDKKKKKDKKKKHEKILDQYCTYITERLPSRTTNLGNLLRLSREIRTKIPLDATEKLQEIFEDIELPQKYWMHLVDNVRNHFKVLEAKTNQLGEDAPVTVHLIPGGRRTDTNMRKDVTWFLYTVFPCDQINRELWENVPSNGLLFIDARDSLDGTLPGQRED